MSTVEEVVDAHLADRDALVAALIEREGSMADALRIAGANFGMFPEIVAEVICEVGLGAQPTDEVRQMIRNNFITLMERLREQHNGPSGQEGS